MANLYLNLGINVADLYKDIDKTQLQEIQKAATDGFTTDELKTLEEDGVDVSLIKDNSVEQPQIDEKETDSQELKDAKAELKELNKQILNNTTQLRNLETDIILLEDEVNEEFENLVDKQQNLEEEQKEEIKEAQAKLQEKYASSEGEMSEDDYTNSLTDEMDKIDSKYGTKFSSIAKDFAINNKKAAQLNDNIEEQGKLAAETEGLKTEAARLSDEINQKQQEHDKALEEEVDDTDSTDDKSKHKDKDKDKTEAEDSVHPEVQAYQELKKRADHSAGIQAYVDKVETMIKDSEAESARIADTSIRGQMEKDRQHANQKK